MIQREEHLSDFAFDRLMVGELEGTHQVLGMRAHLATCATCTARHQELADDAVAFQGQRAAHEQARGSLTDRLARRQRARRRPVVWGAFAAVAAVLVLVLVRRPEPDLRPKGGSLQLEVFVKRTTGAIESLSPGATLEPGDTLRFRASVPSSSSSSSPSSSGAGGRGGYLGVLSIDAADVVSAYFPRAGTLAPLSAGPGQLLDGSTELDQVIGPELLVALLCPEPRDTGQLVTALRGALARARSEARPLDLATAAGGCRHTTFAFRKVAHR